MKMVDVSLSLAFWG